MDSGKIVGSASTAGMRRRALLSQLMSTPSKFRHPIFAPYMQDLTSEFKAWILPIKLPRPRRSLLWIPFTQHTPFRTVWENFTGYSLPRMEHATAHDITSVMSSLARLGIEPPDLFLEQIQKTSARNYRNVQSAGRLQICYAPAILDAVAEHYRGMTVFMRTKFIRM